jgi:hypothetical protein
MTICLFWGLGVGLIIGNALPTAVAGPLGFALVMVSLVIACRRFIRAARALRRGSAGS